MSLNIDFSQLWTAISENFPIFFGILIVPAGIGLAVRLATFVIDRVGDAIK